MSNTANDWQLLSNAIAGDRAALHELLLVHYEPLLDEIAHRISPQIRGVLTADDIIQETFVYVIRHIDEFTPRTDESVYAWLKKIAEHRTQDAIRHLHRKKRGGDYRRAQTCALPHESSVADLVDMLSAGSHTPSRSAARHEAVAAVQQTIDALPDAYRQAVQLRLLAGKSLQETATVMNRSPRAVQGLVDRAKKKMRAALGRLSLYE